MTCALNAIVTAIIEALKADAATAAICGSRIYEEPPRDDRGDPSDAAAPYVYLAGVSWRDIESGCGPIYSVTLSLSAVSTKFGRKESRDLAMAVATALNRKTFSLADGHIMTAIKVVSGDDVPGEQNPKQCMIALRTEVSDANAYF